MGNVWQLQEAKSRLSELIVNAQSEGPQVITKRGVETAIVLSSKDYRKLLGKQKSLVEVFRSCPVYSDDLDLSRVDGPIREVDIQ